MLNHEAHVIRHSLSSLSPCHITQVGPPVLFARSGQHPPDAADYPRPAKATASEFRHCLRVSSAEAVLSWHLRVGAQIPCFLI